MNTVKFPPTPPQPVRSDMFINYVGQKRGGGYTHVYSIVKTRPLLRVLNEFELLDCVAVVTSGDQAFRRVEGGGWIAARPNTEDGK